MNVVGHLDVRQRDGSFRKRQETNHMATLLMNTTVMYTLECYLRAYIQNVSLYDNESLRGKVLFEHLFAVFLRNRVFCF